jgi:hypothetical protein
MAPLPWLRITFSSCFMQAHTPRRLIAVTRSNASADSSAASLTGSWIPALLNAMSSRPNRSTLAASIAATWSSSATSQRTARTECPASASSSAADVKSDWLMSASTTAAPASANARAVDRPMPELAPVTRATWPVKS